MTEIERCEYIADHYLRESPKSTVVLILLRERELSRIEAQIERDDYLRKLFRMAALGLIILSCGLGFSAGRLWERYRNGSSQAALQQQRFVRSPMGVHSLR